MQKKQEPPDDCSPDEDMLVHAPDGRVWKLTWEEYGQILGWSFDREEEYAANDEVDPVDHEKDDIVSGVLKIEAQTGVRLKNGANPLDFLGLHRKYWERREVGRIVRDEHGAIVGALPIMSFAEYMQKLYPEMIELAPQKTSDIRKKTDRPTKVVLLRQLEQYGNPAAVQRHCYPDRSRQTVYNWCYYYGLNWEEFKEKASDRRSSKLR